MRVSWRDLEVAFVLQVPFSNNLNTKTNSTLSQKLISAPRLGLAELQTAFQSCLST